MLRTKVEMKLQGATWVRWYCSGISKRTGDPDWIELCPSDGEKRSPGGAAIVDRRSANMQRPGRGHKTGIDGARRILPTQKCGIKDRGNYCRIEKLFDEL